MKISISFVWMLLSQILLGVLQSVAVEPAWVWAQKANADARAVAVDSNGNAYIAGWFSETNVFGTNVLSPYDGFSDIFLVKVNPQGNYLWANCATGAMFDRVRDIDVDPQGNVLLTGEFSKNLAFGSHVVQVAQNDYDVFISKAGLDGAFLWAVRGGGGSDDIAYGVASDPAGNVIVVGQCSGNAVFGSFTNTLNDWSYFVAKLDPAGQYLWVNYGRPTQTGGSVWLRDVDVDAASNIYVIGTFTGSNLVVGASTLVTASPQTENMFVMKLAPNGNGLWAVQGGQTNFTLLDDGGDAIVMDSKGNALITGTFGLRGRFGPFLLTSKQARDMFVAKLDPDGAFLWATNATGTNAALAGDAIACGVYDTVIICGAFEGTAEFGSHKVVARNNSADVFVTKLSSQGEFLWAARAGGDYTDYAYGIGVLSDGDAMVVGTLKGASDFGVHKVPGVWFMGSWRNQMYAARMCAFSPPWISEMTVGADSVLLDCNDMARSETIALESSTNLMTGDWDPVTNWIPNLTTGRVDVPIAPDERALFFRLRHR